MNNDRMRFLAGLPAAPKVVVAAVEVVEPVVEEVATVEPVVEEVTPAEPVVAETATGDHVVELTTEVLANATIHEFDVEAEIVAALAASIIAEESEPKGPELDNEKENAGKTSKVPSDVSSALNKRVSELKQSLSRYGDKGAKQNAVDALEKIADLLKLEDGLADAALFYGTLMSPITDLFPPTVVKFLHTSPATKKGSAAVTEARYNQDFEADDQIGHGRLKQALTRLDDKVELVGNRSDEETNNYVSGWCQSNIAQAFWNHAADHLDDLGFSIAASNMREHAAESGYH